MIKYYSIDITSKRLAPEDALVVSESFKGVISENETLYNKYYN